MLKVGVLFDISVYKYKFLPFNKHYVPYIKQQNTTCHGFAIKYDCTILLYSQQTAI